jgi:hypothetical protein
MFMFKNIKQIKVHMLIVVTLLSVGVNALSPFLPGALTASAATGAERDTQLQSLAKTWLAMRILNKARMVNDTKSGGTGCQTIKIGSEKVALIVHRRLTEECGFRYDASNASNPRVGFFLAKDDGEINGDNEALAIFDAALKVLGYENYTAFYDALGYKAGASDRLEGGSFAEDKLLTLLKKIWPSTVELPTFGPDDNWYIPKWMQYLDLFEAAKIKCTARKDPLAVPGTSGGQYTLQLVDTGAETVSPYQANKLVTGWPDTVDQVSIADGYPWALKAWDCAGTPGKDDGVLARLTDASYAQSYLDVLTKLKTSPSGGEDCATKYPRDAALAEACTAGQEHYTDTTYCDTTYTGNATGIEACKYGQELGKANNLTTDPSTAAESDPTCTVEGIGWIVCPVMDFMATINDVLYGALEKMLAVNPEIFGNDSTTGVYGAWNVFRGYANILFIIVFLIIIYSQITSVGITSYGIKKLLPKLVVAAILVNTSYYICQLLVDISNIAGVGIKALFTSMGAGIAPVDSATSESSWSYWVGAALAATAGAGALVALALAISVPVVLSALLALLMVVLILIVRQALIILLIAVSPLAFVAWLLPNTEKWFKKWWELLFSMLMLFPIISALFGAGVLAGAILGTLDFGDDGGAAKLAALGATVLPLILTIPILQNSLKATGSLGSKLSGLSGKANARIGSKVKDTSMAGALSKQYTRQRSIKRAQVLGGQKGVGGFINKRINRMTGSLGKGISAAGASTALKLRNEDVENAVSQMQSQWQPHEELANAKEAYAAALKKGDVVQARAAQKLLLGKGGAGVAAIRDVVRHGEFDHTSDAARGAKADLASAGLKSKDAGLNAWSYDSKERTLGAIDKDKDTYGALTDAELSTQSTGSIKRALRSGGIDATRAKRIVENGDLQGNLTGDSHTALDVVGRGGTPPADDPDETRYTKWTTDTKRTPNP